MLLPFHGERVEGAGLACRGLRALEEQSLECERRFVEICKVAGWR